MFVFFSLLYWEFQKIPFFKLQWKFNKTFNYSFKEFMQLPLYFYLILMLFFKMFSIFIKKRCKYFLFLSKDLYSRSLWTYFEYSSHYISPTWKLWSLVYCFSNMIFGIFFKFSGVRWSRSRLAINFCTK